MSQILKANPDKSIKSNLLDLENFSKKKRIPLCDNIQLKRQSKLESNARSYPRRIPISLAKAQGIYIQDTQGNIYIDCLSCAGSLALGHNHPAVKNAILNHLAEDTPLQTLDITSPTKDKFIQDLFEILPIEFTQKARVQFCSPSGSDAVEAAIKLAKTATGRQGILSFSGGYHGMTHGALSLMGSKQPKAAINGLMPEVQMLPYPYLYRCPFGLEGEKSIDVNLHYIENLFSDPESGVLLPAAVIVEAVQGEGGMIPAPIRWLKGLREITKKFDIPLILDEVQSGIGRTGKMFAFEHADIVPDVVVISKAIGGGLPLSLIVYQESLDEWLPGAHAGTFRGNLLAMATGSATLEVIHSQQLQRHAQLMGSYLIAQLKKIQNRFAYFGDVRGLGLMIGVEVVDIKQERHPTFTQLASTIQRQCLNNGLILEIGGRNGSTLRFLPALVIQKHEIDKVVEVFDKSVQEAAELMNINEYNQPATKLKQHNITPENIPA